MDSSEKEPQQQQNTSQSTSPVIIKSSDLQMSHTTLRDSDVQQNSIDQFVPSQSDSVTKTPADNPSVTKQPPLSQTLSFRQALSEENIGSSVAIVEEEKKTQSIDDTSDKVPEESKSNENHHPYINEALPPQSKEALQEQNKKKKENHQSSSDVSSTSQEDNDSGESSSDNSKGKAKPKQPIQQSKVIDPADHTQQQQSVEEKKQDENIEDENEEEGEEEDEEEEEEEEEEVGVKNPTYNVIEISPKGRFTRFDEELGRGAYKIVYKGVDYETGREIAWNVINLNRLPKQDRIRIKSEIDLIKKLDHQNIIHFISAWYNKEKEQVVFITEMITGGSLRKYVKRIKTPRLKVIKGWCKQILKGLVYLHQQKPHPIIHRDLKCDNIFINSNSGEIRIGDLGLSTPMQHSFTTSVLGTPEFMAPELYEECYGTGVDIYAFGMCVLEMITLERPYKECQNPAQIYNKVIRGIAPQALERIIDEEVKQFIAQCLYKEEQRPSAQELLDSRFLNDLDTEKNNMEVQITKALVQVGGKKNDLNEAQQKAIKKMQKMNGSTIIEEEEENSGGGTALHQEIKDIKAQNPSVIDTQNDVKDNNVNHQLETTQKIQEEQNNQASMKNQQPIVEVNNTDLKQNQEIISQQLATEQQTLQQEAQELQQQKQLQYKGSQSKLDKSKLKKRDQRLNESVIFLKKIDEEKQKKMQEKTIIANSQAMDDNSDDVDVPPNKNILDDLKKEDEQEQQRLAAATTQSLLPKQITVEQTQSKDQKSQIENPQKYDLKKKNFKEDDPKQQAVLPQSQVPPAQKQTQQQSQATKKVNTSDLTSKTTTTAIDDQPKRINSNLIPNLILQQQAQHHHNSQSQIQNPIQSEILKKPHNQSLHQQSDDILLHNPSMINEKSALTSDPHVSNDLFDNQSSSSNNSGEIGGHDSEVDKITMPKLQPQPQDLLLQQKSLESQKANQPQIAVQQQQQKATQQANSHQQQKVEKTPPPVAEIKTGATNNNANTNGKNIPSNTQAQLKSQSQIGTLSKQNTENNVLLKSQQLVNNQQVQQNAASTTKAQTKDTNSVNQIPMQKSNSIQASQQSGNKQHANQASSAETKRPQENKMVRMQFKIADKEVTFDFDTSSDTPDGVAKEMVKELRLHESQVEVISKEIQNTILKNSQKTLSVPAGTTEQQKLPSSSQIPHSQQKSQLQQQQQILQNPQSSQQNTNKPYQKSSKMQLSNKEATSMFDKLFADIEYFYSRMQSLGIETTDQIVEVMDCSTEEKNIRMTFFNKVLMAKKEYKSNIEQLKQQKLKQKLQQNEGSENKQQKGAYQSQAGEEIKIGNLTPQIISSTQKILYMVPKYIRLHFKQSPYQFQIIPKLTKPLKKRDPAEDALNNIDPYSVEDEVTQLQNLLNLLWFDSIIIQSEKAPTKEEGQQIINNHIPLKVDGYFGEKTEKCVIKFQKYKELTKNGIVTDHIWNLMINHADQIIVEARKQLNSFDLQKELQKQQFQIQSLNSKEKLGLHPSHHPMVSQNSSNNLIKLAVKEKQTEPIKPPPPIVVPQDTKISNPNEQPQHPQIQGGMNVSSPTKTQISSRQDHVIDYKAMIEQHFIPQQKPVVKDEGEHNEEANQEQDETPHDEQNDNNY